MSELNNSVHKKKTKPSKPGEILVSLKLMIHFHYGPRSHPSNLRETNTNCFCSRKLRLLMMRIASLLLCQMMDEQPKETGETAQGSSEKLHSHF